MAVPGGSQGADVVGVTRVRLAIFMLIAWEVEGGGGCAGYRASSEEGVGSGASSL